MKQLLRRLRSTLSPSTSELRRAAATWPVLAGYGDAHAVLSALSRGSPLLAAERDALVRVVVLERRASQHALWSTLLVLIFEPALHRLRRRLGHRVDDADGMLVQALFEGADSVSPRAGAMVLGVRRAMARKLFQKLSAARMPPVEPLDPGLPERPWHCEPPAFVACAAREVLRACARVPGATEAALACAGLAARQDGPTGAGKERKGALERARGHHKRALTRVRQALDVAAASTPGPRDPGRWSR